MRMLGFTWMPGFMRTRNWWIVPAALLLGSPDLGFAAGAAPEVASSADKARAEAAFVKGDEAFDALKYGEALVFFQSSYEAVASPNSRLMIARCLLELGRLDEAYDEFVGVIVDAGDNDAYEDTSATADKERAALSNRLAWLEIRRGDVPDDAKIVVGNRPRSSEALGEAVALMPGHTRIVATASDGAVASADVYLAAARSAEVTLALGKTVVVGTPPLREGGSEPQGPQSVTEDEQPREAEGSSRKSLLPWAFAAGGIGLAGGGAFAAFGILSGNHYESLKDDCVDGVCPAESQDDIDKGKQYQTFANVGLGVCIAGVATSAILFVLETKAKKNPLEVTVGYPTVSLKGQF